MCVGWGVGVAVVVTVVVAHSMKEEPITRMMSVHTCMYMSTNKCQTHALAALPPPGLADEAGGRQRVVEAERGVEAGLGLVVAHLVAHVLVAVAVCVWGMLMVAVGDWGARCVCVWIYLLFPCMCLYMSGSSISR